MSTVSRLNWNVGFCEGRKTSGPRNKPLKYRQEPMTNSTQATGVQGYHSHHWAFPSLFPSVLFIGFLHSLFMEVAWPEGLGDWTRPFNLFIPRSDQKECSPYFINTLSKGKKIRNGRGGM